MFEVWISAKARKSESLVVGIFGLMMTGVVWNGSAAASNHCPKNVKLGWEEYKPYQFQEGKEVTGSDIEVFTQVLRKVGCAFKLVKSPWERTLMEVGNGKMLFAAGATITSEREKFAYFTEPYDVENIYPYVLKKRVSAPQLGSMNAMIDAGFKFVTTAGATFGDEFDALVKSGKLQKDKNHFEVTSEKQAAEMLALGRVDVFLASGDGLTFNDEVVNGPVAIFKNETRFMISKKSGSQEFLSKVNAAIAELHKDGTFKAIKKKYFGK